MEKKFKLTTMVLMVALAILGVFALSSCEKNKLEPIDQEVELVVQTFGLENVSNINIKSWDYDTWEWNFNQTLTILSLTGVGNSIGNNYTIETTINDLVLGNVTIEMLKGTYDISFETPHIISTHSNYTNGITDFANHPYLSESLDIKIDMQSVLIEGSPIDLTATINDLLVIIDVPKNQGIITITDFEITPFTKLIRNTQTSNFDYTWGYFAMDERERGNIDPFIGLKILFTVPNVGDIYLDASNWQLGKVYHVQTNQSTTFNIDLPPMETINVYINGDGTVIQK